jgi:hypothetical protein
VADHPVKVPPELVQQWLSEPYKDGTAQHIANRSAQWAADQELEAWCEWVFGNFVYGTGHANCLRDARRPKPPTLAEQGLAALETGCSLTDDGIDIIKAALQRLKQLENQP